MNTHTWSSERLSLQRPRMSNDLSNDSRIEIFTAEFMRVNFICGALRRYFSWKKRIKVLVEKIKEIFCSVLELMKRLRPISADLRSCNISTSFHKIPVGLKQKKCFSNNHEINISLTFIFHFFFTSVCSSAHLKAAL